MVHTGVAIRYVPLTVVSVRAMHGILRVTTCLLLLGHGALGAFNSKPALTAHYAFIGLQNLVVAVSPHTGGRLLGDRPGCRRPRRAAPSLLMSVCLWKMGTEALFMTAGSLPFEWIERAGSYMAPWRYTLSWSRTREGKEGNHVDAAMVFYEARRHDPGDPYNGTPRPQ